MGTPVDVLSMDDAIDLTRYATAEEIAEWENGTEEIPDPPAPEVPGAEDFATGLGVAHADQGPHAAAWDSSLWVPYTKHLYAPGLDHGVRQRTVGVVIHENVGTYAGTIGYFTDGASQGVGAHFEIGGRNDGPPVQFLPLDRKAWHAVEANADRIGIEHAGFGRTREEWLGHEHQDELWISAQRCAWILHRYNLGKPVLSLHDLSKGNIWPHNAGGLSWGGHSCPGSFFPWDVYIPQVERAYDHHWAR